MDELNGRMIACQILITGLIERVKGVNIGGMENADRVRQIAQHSIDELFALMKPPSVD